ncbi:MAG: sigma-70 family RNA polymerase sigma factor [Sediminibacterium sp.]
MDNIYLQKVLEGDVSKFSFFIEKYRDMAFSIAFRIINNREDAEEIVQDSFLKVFKALSKFKRDSKFSTWFYRIVVNNSLSRLKRDKAVPTYVDVDKVSNVVIEKVESVYKGLTHSDQQKFINIALVEMSVEDRLLLTLYYLNENTLEEITEITDIAQENLKMKIHRARKKMFIILGKTLKSEIQNLL